MQTGRYSFIKIFEATFITTRENFYGLLDDFNQEHTDYFINPLLRIKFSQAENLLIVNGYLVDKELVKDFGEISVLPISNDKISVRFNCFLSDYEWAIQRYQGEWTTEMGYQAGESVDEQGSVWIVPMLGRENELKLVAEEC